MNYYEVLDIPVAYQPDAAALRLAFLQRSRETHPDHSTHLSEQEQAERLALSAAVNRAFRVLQHPDSRLQHLLELYGVWREDDPTAPPQSPAFLMEMMELNEAAEEAANNPAAAAEVLRQLEEQITGRQHVLENVLAPFDAQPPEEAAARVALLQKVLPVFLELRTLQRTRSRLQAPPAR